jgi:glutathione S-transferase
MINLYYSKYSRASRVRWALEEAGSSYSLIPIDFETTDIAQSGLPEVHPLEALPAMTDGDLKLFETGALCMYVADRSGKLAPSISDSHARAKYYQWIFYAATELDPKTVEIYLQTEGYDDDKRNTKVLADTREAFKERVAVLEKHLAHQPFMLGKDFSMVDVIVGSIMSWAGSMDLLKDFPIVTKYCETLQKRPAFIRAQAE